MQIRWPPCDRYANRTHEGMRNPRTGFTAGAKSCPREVSSSAVSDDDANAAVLARSLQCNYTMRPTSSLYTLPFITIVMAHPVSADEVPHPIPCTTDEFHNRSSQCPETYCTPVRLALAQQESPLATAVPAYPNIVPPSEPGLHGQPLVPYSYYERGVSMKVTGAVLLSLFPMLLGGGIGFITSNTLNKNDPVGIVPGFTMIGFAATHLIASIPLLSIGMARSRQRHEPAPIL